MADRYRRRAEPSQREAVFGTFHAFFYRILRDHHIRFRILTESEKHQLIRPLWRHYAPGTDYADYVLSLEERRTKKTSDEDLTLYLQSLTQQGLLDYTALGEEALSLLARKPEAAAAYRARFAFLQVDEFQDISPEQYALLKILAPPPHGNLLVVGDDDQSIYRFRGAVPGVFRAMLEDYPDASRVLLNENFRSSSRITEAASLIIKENTDRFGKRILPRGPEGPPVRILCHRDEKAEYRYITEQITALPEEALSKDGRARPASKSTAVIFRNHRQLSAFARSPGLSPLVDPDLRAQQEAEELQLSWLRLAYDLPRGAGRLQDLLSLLRQEHILYLREQLPGDGFSAAQLFASFHGTPGAPRMEAILKELRLLSMLTPEKALARIRIRTGTDLSPRLAALAAREKSLQKFLEAAQTLPPPARRGLPRMETPSGILQLLTMHGAKGLEFDRVFVPDLTEGLFPGRYAGSPEDLEEERRLLYVAMTRARTELSLHYVSGTPEDPRRPSRFLAPLGINHPFDVLN